MTGGSACDVHRAFGFAPTLTVTGPTSRDASYKDPRDVHVIVRGDTLVRGAETLAAHYEDGSVERRPIAWPGKSIDAGFFIYEIPKRHGSLGSAS